MCPFCAFRTRRVWLALLAGLVLFSWNSTLLAVTVPQVVRVEEDWELKVATPDADNDAPQVSCVISPVADLDSVHAALLLNHQTLPDYVAGGVQLQVWNGESPRAYHRYSDTDVMSQPDETVTWTQTMKLQEGLLTFEVVNGRSATWGEFGDQGLLKSSVASSLANLNGYDPAVSVRESGVDFAGNRVKSLVLKKVRLVLADGQVLEDDTPRVVHEQPSQ